MAEKLGIDEVKAVLGMSFSLGELIESLSDGVGISDFLKLVSVAKKVPSAISAFKSGKVLPELKDLDESEKADLKQYVKDNFDLADDKVEAAIESGLYVAIDLCDLLKIGG